MRAGQGRKFSAKRTARAEAVALKDRKALELRKAGGSYAEIGRELGYSNKQGAFTAVQRALAAITEEPAKELLTLYRERLDRMYLGLVKAGAYDGDARSVLAACRVLELHAKLSGALRNDGASVNVTAEGGGAVVINVTAGYDDVLGKLARIAGHVTEPALPEPLDPEETPTPTS